MTPDDERQRQVKGGDAIDPPQPKSGTISPNLYIGDRCAY